MPQLRTNETVEVHLPSYGEIDPAVVVLQKRVTTGDIVDAGSEGANMTDRQRALIVLSKTIVSWNLMDGDKPTPVTVEAIRQLDVQDFITLLRAMKLEGMKELEEEKKSV